MGSSSCDHMKIDAAECSETTVEIKIKTLDSRTFTLRVDKCVPVPELKEQIASVTGVISEQQRLICRGKVLKDDQLLSAYHVEDGHTLHMVVQRPFTPSAEQSDDPADPMPSAGQVPGSRASPSMVVGTFNISEQGDGALPDLNRILSAVLSSLGAARSGSGGEGNDLNQPSLARLIRTPGLSASRNSNDSSDQPASVEVEPQQPPVIPDSMTTLQQYLSHLRQVFSAYAGGQSANARNTVFSASDGEAAAIEPRRLLTPESLAEVLSSARVLLVEQVNECMLQLAGQLESQLSVTDTSERSRIQSNALRSGGLFQNLGAMFLELGRATMTLRMGRTPAGALVNAGPPVFISSTGPNPLMVQPLPFQPGSVPAGTVQRGSGLGGNSVGSGFLPRNIDIRIRTGSLLSRRDSTGSQPQGQTGTPSSNGANSGQQDAAPTVDSNSRNRESQLRAVPLRTVVAAVPAPMSRSSDSTRGSIGIVYPILARVQHVSSGNSNGSRASQASDQHHVPNANVEQPIPVSAAQSQNVAAPGNGSRTSPSEELHDHGIASQIRDGLYQMLTTLFPGAQVVNVDSESPASDSVPNRTESAQDIGSSQQTASATASAVSDEGVLLSNILRQIMPMLSENIGAEPETPPSTEGADADEPQVDDNTGQGSSRRRCGSQSEPNSKRRRRG